MTEYIYVNRQILEDFAKVYNTIILLMEDMDGVGRTGDGRRGKASSVTTGYRSYCHLCKDLVVDSSAYRRQALCISSEHEYRTTARATIMKHKGSAHEDTRTQRVTVDGNSKILNDLDMQQFYHRR